MFRVGRWPGGGLRRQYNPPPPPLHTQITHKTPHTTHIYSYSWPPSPSRWASSASSTSRPWAPTRPAPSAGSGPRPRHVFGCLSGGLWLVSWEGGGADQGHMLKAYGDPDRITKPTTGRGGAQGGLPHGHHRAPRAAIRPGGPAAQLVRDLGEREGGSGGIFGVGVWASYSSALVRPTNQAQQHTTNRQLP